MRTEPISASAEPLAWPVSWPAAEHPGGAPHTGRIFWPLVAADLAAVCVPGLIGSFHLYLVAAAAVSVALLAILRRYERRLSFSGLADTPVLVFVAVTALFVATCGNYLAGRGLDRTDLVIGLLSYPAALVITRAVSYQLINRHRRHHSRGQAVILGSGHTAARLITALQADRRYGIVTVGLLCHDDDPIASAPSLAALRWGEPRQLESVILHRGITDVFLATSDDDEDELLGELRRCDHLPARFYLVPRMFQRMVSLVGRHGDQVGAMPVLRMRPPAYRGPLWRLKRGFDILASLIILLLVGPIMIAVAIAVRLENGPGVIFRQTRIGVNGRAFTLLKFQSMRPLSEGESQTTWSIAADPRVGRVGRFIRRYSLDELPQLINVLRGDMSIVGPRPERPHFVAEFGREHAEYADRHRVEPGLTGLAAVNHLRGDTSIADRALFDNVYIDNWSPWLDVRILLLTVGEVIRGSGA